MINFQNVACTFGSQDAGVKNINLNIGEDDFVFLVGPNGAGKSTLLRLIYMDCLPDDGLVQIKNYRSDKIREKDIPKLRRQIGMIFQDFKLLDDRNVYQNVAISLYISHHKTRKIKNEVHEKLNQLNLGHRVHYKPDNLSGGEKQMVAIARALIKDPIVILADEPTGDLDPRASIEVIDQLHKINQENKAVIVATHDYNLVKRVPDARIISLKDGQITSMI
ncbi:MAG: ATP-binding cassette domain-containing protein [Candidatus Marinimicrobia bacterium]|nr:ATP-binding cassette domain-containing protein [Candidatus Neomarinimicrobiota bacterium]